MTPTVSSPDHEGADAAPSPGESRKLLVERWTAIHKRRPPKGMSTLLLERAAAYQAQVDAFGGLSIKTRKDLRSLRASDKKSRCKSQVGAEPTVTKPGMRLVREWNGQVFSVDVVEEGFVWDGRRYRSLSAIARVITGTRWSGPRFFGL